MKFTETNIKNIPAVQKEIRDSSTTGLVLRVSPKGKKTWNFLYRKEGKLTRINIGVWPSTSLNDAKAKVLEYRTNIDGGKPALAVSTKGMTIAHIYKEWIVIKRRKLKRPEVIEGIFANHLLPDLGEYSVEAITPQAIIQTLNIRVERGQSGTAGIALQSIKELLSYSTMMGYIAVNPLAEMTASKLGIKKAKRDRVLSLEELKTIWNSDYDGLVVPMLQFMALTFLRGGEIRQLEWDWIDLEERIIKLPPSVMKSGIAHDVYLTDRMIEILNERLKFRLGKYVWISGYHDRLLPRTYLPVATRYLRMHENLAHFVPHDFRRNVSYLCDKCDVSWDIADMLLAHRPSGIMGTYQRGTLWEQRKDALIKWDKYLLCVTD